MACEEGYGGIVYLNGQFLPTPEAKVSVLDRGFVFGDGVYEVIPVYGARPFRLEEHLRRLDASLAGIRLANPLTHGQWRECLLRLVAENGAGDQSLYLQVTRGAARRDHAFPASIHPTVFAMSSPLEEVPGELRRGISAITVEDIRWKLCSIKSIALLPNILLRQEAIDRGAAEAIMLRDGLVTEAVAANVFVVAQGTVATPPKSNLLLPGTTRDLIVELCASHAIPCEERDITAEQLRSADEIWVTSSTRDLLPVIRLDGQPVGSGSPGPIGERVLLLYQQYKAEFRAGTRD